MHYPSTRSSYPAGAVSLFVVVFAALLMTVVTVGFIQLMVKDQQQATANDLSQSARDSAMAGVEDAKRLLLLQQACASGTAAKTVNCTTVRVALNPVPGTRETACDALAQSGLVVEQNNEVPIQQSVGDTASALDQAYTCVKIMPDTDDYRGQLAANESAIVPLQGVSGFNQVEINWFSRSDVAAGINTITYPKVGSVALPPVGSLWAPTTPSLLRAQLMQTGQTFQLDDFDDAGAGKSNANTVFLYPSAAGLTSGDFASDARRAGTNAPLPVRCENAFATKEYVCSMRLTLPDAKTGSNAQRGAYLRLSSLYNNAHFTVRLLDTTTNATVQFDGVQPQVDATGRANTLFRRVQARVELKGAMAYPEAAVDLAGSLCKNFLVTDDPKDYDPSSCTP